MSKKQIRIAYLVYLLLLVSVTIGLIMSVLRIP